ncbi:MAG: TonB-dependent receptor plug domain-containing protein [Bacteroidetes bacterium]|nr:TonB-dependent receptor plug domain-containing protein [Bacteroidota bacterium]
MKIYRKRTGTSILERIYNIVLFVNNLRDLEQPKAIFTTTRRKLQKKVILLLLLCFISSFMYSQDCDDVSLNEALKEYEIGNFGEVFTLLSGCLKSGFNNEQKVEAYKLFAITYIAIDSIDLATIESEKILRTKPNFETDLFDPPRFVQIIDELKSQGSSLLVTSVSKKAENILEAPATVIIITEEDIVNRGYLDLEQLMHDLPGFDIAKGSGPGYSLLYQRGYRSTGNDRFLLLIDGVEENDLNSDNVAIARQYSLSNIKRIEVVYGPASTMYGANAFIGVINLFTKSSEDIIKKDHYLGMNVQSCYGSWNTKYIDATIAAKKKDVSFVLTGRYFHSTEMNFTEKGYSEWQFSPESDSFYRQLMGKSGQDADGNYNAQEYIDQYGMDILPSAYYNVTYNTDNTATDISLNDAGVNKAKELDSLNFNSSIDGYPIGYDNHFNNWLINGKLKVKNFTLGIQSWRTNQGALPWYTTKSRLSTEKHTRWITWNSFFYLDYNKAVGDKLLFTNQTSYRLHSIDGNTNFAVYSGYYNSKYNLYELVTEKAPATRVVYYYRVSNQLRNETRLFYIPSSEFNILSGIEFRSSIIQGNYMTSSQAHPDEIYTPSSTATPIPGGNNFRTLDLGIFSQASYSFTQQLMATLGGRVDYNKIRQEGGYGIQFSPRAAIVFHPDNYVIKIIYAEAFKDASFLTKYATSTSRLLSNPTLTPERVRNIELCGFYKITEELSVDVVGYYAMYSNVVGLAEASMPDGTATLQFQPVGKQTIYGLQATSRFRLRNYDIWANYSYTRPINDDSNLRISDIPSHSFNIGGNTLLFKHLNINLRANFVGKRLTGVATSGSNNPISEFDPYFVLHGTIGYIDLLKGLTLQLQLNNITNAEYFDPGVRDADGTTYASRLPQNKFGIMFKVLYNY